MGAIRSSASTTTTTTTGEAWIRELLQRIDDFTPFFVLNLLGTRCNDHDRERQFNRQMLEGILPADGGNNDTVREIFSQPYDAVRRDVVSSLLAELPDCDDPDPPVREARMHARDDPMSSVSTQSPPMKRRRFGPSETGNQDQEEGSSGALPLYMDTIDDTDEPQEQEQAEDPPAPQAGDGNEIDSMEYSTSAAPLVEDDDDEKKGEE
jgi:hypothetical protein